MGIFVLVLGAAALIAVLVSAISSRSPLSTTAVFLIVGLAAGPVGLDLVDLSEKTVEHAAEIALFVILFVDGQHAPWSLWRRHLPRASLALLVAMPATFAIVAAAGHWLVGLPWPAALVLGAVLAPTDPVFASALVGRDDVPEGTRSLLNLESGLNDGLALIAVLGLVGLAGADVPRWSTDPWTLALEAGLGAVVGVAVPLAILVLLRLPGLGSVDGLRALGPIAVGLILYGVCDLAHLNQFLAAFAGGATLASVQPESSAAFGQVDEVVSELVKGGALLAFASLVVPEDLAGVIWPALAVAAIALLIARPLPVVGVLAPTSMSRRESFAVAWFGPKGFASVAYGVIVASSTLEGSEEILAVVTVVVLASVVLHSSTDVTVATWLRSGQSPGEGTDPESRAAEQQVSEPAGAQAGSDGSPRD